MRTTLPDPPTTLKQAPAAGLSPDVARHSAEIVCRQTPTPAEFVASEAIEHVVGWFLAGLVQAAVVRLPRSKVAE